MGITSTVAPPPLMCLSSSPLSDDASALSPCAMARCETPTCLALTRTTGRPSFLVDPSGADVLAADGASANKLAGMRSVSSSLSTYHTEGARAKPLPAVSASTSCLRWGDQECDALLPPSPFEPP